MAGVSEMPFRVLARRMGAGAAPTELVSAKGLLYGQSRTARYLTHDPIVETPFWVQIFGGEPDVMAEGAERAVELGAHIIDINMGCPVKKVTKCGAGSALLTDPMRARAIVEAIVKRTSHPVTVKIRTGWDDHSINCVEMAKALADGGCSAVAMHGRTRAQGYSGKADWSLIARLVEHAPIPVIGNGDIVTAADAHRMLRETGCAAVMIGRGALGNPWLFQELVCSDDPSTQPFVPPTPQERWSVIAAHFQQHLLFVGDTLQGIRRFRSHLMWYAHGLYGAAAFRQHVTQIDDLETLLPACEKFFASAHCGYERTSEFPECDTRTALG